MTPRAASPRPRTARALLEWRLAVGVLTLAALVAAGCGSKKSDGGSNTPPGADSSVPPVLRDAGVPTGEPSGASIGPNGGTLSSGDGGVTIIVPPGAVTSPTSFSIQPITSTALGAVEGAYRIKPDGGTLAAPVTVVLRGPERYAAGTSIEGLGISYQDATGFWFPVKGVVRDARANTLTVTTNHFSDWGVVWAAGVPGLYGTFTLSQTIGLPVDASGTAALFFQGSNATKSLYVLTGNVAVPATISSGTRTCTPSSTSGAMAPTVAELWTSAPAQFRWSINGQWELACVNSLGSPTTEFAAAMFDTLGINLIGCARAYVGTPILTPERLQGTYAIDCGAQGKVTASWDFLACIPGTVCQGPDPCHVAVISCDTGAPVCTTTTTPTANGTSCGAGQVCNAGACVACAAGTACTSSNPCHTAAITCDTGSPVCTDSGNVADGTTCGVDQVCSAGTCVACVAGGACTSTNPCHTATLSCATGSQVCTDTGNQPDGTVCGAGLACTAGACACAAGTTCASTNPCHTAAYTCDPTTGAAVCTDNGNVANGTSCGANLVCNNGACEPCTAGAACTSTTDPTCKTAAITCDTGVPVCTDTGNVVDGTACGPGLACTAGACACAAGQACVSQNPCMDAAIACDPTTGAPICTDTIAKPDGTVCGTNQVCSAGACVGCVPGNGCTPAANVCEIGSITSCATGPTCTGTGTFQPAGTSCGTNQVCNAAGACVSCTTGAACPLANPCHAGVISCTTGSPVCTDTGNVPDGTTCGTNQVCSGGTCTGCTVGNACTTGNPCDIATFSSCTSGPVCTATGSLPDGTACGTLLNCSAGTCACVAGTVCPPSDDCHTGAVSCDPITGAPSCVQTAKAPGSTCGSNLVCDAAGSCVSCAAGATCTPVESPCLVGSTSCTTGAPVCTATATPVADGTICGVDQVCSAGSCVPCAAGAACTPAADPCLVGVTSCTTGALVCIATATPVPNGTTCGAGQVCSAGACVPCTEGAACNPGIACHGGTTSCGTGTPVCNDAGLLPAGTSCGDGLVCDSAGGCVPCSEGAACSPGTVCHGGTTSCSTGAPVCTDTGQLPAGTSCGTDLICDGLGACVSCVQGEDCTPADACVQSLNQCGSGTPTCTPTSTPVREGLPCTTSGGAAGLCQAGVCIGS